MITALLTALLLTQGVQAPRQFESWEGFNPFGSTVSVPLNAPLSSNGALLAEDAGTVAHVYFDGRHNYVTRSDEFNLTWVAAAVTISADVAAGPDGAVTADRMTANAGSTEHNVNQTPAAAGAPTLGLWSVWVKYENYAWVLMRGGSATRRGWFNAQTCTAGGGSAGTAVGAAWGANGWCQIWMSGDYTMGMFGTIGFTDSIGGLVQNLSGTETVLLARAQVNVGVTAPTAYAPTTTAAITSVALDTKGNAWTTNGLPLAVQGTSSPFVPGKAGAGPFSSSNYFSGSTSLMEWGGGDWSATYVFTLTSYATTQILGGKGTAATGWSARISSSGLGTLVLHDGATKSVATVNAAVLNSINVLTVGVSGGLAYVRLNGGSAGNALVGAITAAPSNVYIGRWLAAGLEATTSTVYEMIASTTAYSDALHLARFASVWGQAALTVSRSLDTQTYSANGSTWTAPAGALATESSGASIWKAATNYAFPSEDISVWNVSGVCTVTANQGPAGYTDLDLVTCTGLVDSRNLIAAAVGSATQGPVTHCATVAADTGTKVVTVGIDGPDGTWTMSCSRSDGGSCTTGVSSTSWGFAYASVGTTPVRLCVTGTTTGTAGTGWIPFVHDGQMLSTATVGALFGRSQVEVGGYATPYIPTAAAAATRNLTAVTIPNPLSGTGPTKWCLAGTWTPGRPWGQNGKVLLSARASGANNFTIYENGGVLAFYTDNAAAARKQGVTAAISGWSGAQRIVFCDNAGTLTACRNGVSEALTVSGAGDGYIASWAATLNLGGSPTPNFEFDGNISNVKICKGATKCSDCR
jgi:hypothetical protein